MREGLVTAAAGVRFHHVFRMGDSCVLGEQPNRAKLRAAASTPVRLLETSLRVEESRGWLLLEDRWWVVMWTTRRNKRGCCIFLVLVDRRVALMTRKSLLGAEHLAALAAAHRSEQCYTLSFADAEAQSQTTPINCC